MVQHFLIAHSVSFTAISASHPIFQSSRAGLQLCKYAMTLTYSVASVHPAARSMPTLDDN